jgi:hypothetical protein
MCPLRYSATSFTCQPSVRFKVGCRVPAPRHEKDLTISAPTLSRRSLLCLLATAPILASLPGCTRSTGLQGSFLQLWKSHADLNPQQWRERLAAMADMGCRTVTLQWVGLIGGQSPWMMPEAMLRNVFDIAHEQGMQVSGCRSTTPGGRRCRRMSRGRRSSSPRPWARRRLSGHLALAAAQRLCRLVHPLRAGAVPLGQCRQPATPGRLAGCDVCQHPTAQRPYPVDFHLPQRAAHRGSLLQLWRTLLDTTALRPVVQDGVGVAGWTNLQAIEPLLLELRRRRCHSMWWWSCSSSCRRKNDGTDFKARSADYARVAPAGVGAHHRRRAGRGIRPRPLGAGR